MKKINYILTIFLLLHSVIIADIMIVEDTERIETIPGDYDWLTVYTVTQVQPYVAGGLVFTYPAGLYSQAPRVAVTLEDFSMTLTTTNIAAAWITQNSATQTTVLVVTDNGAGGFVEAPTNGVNVHLLAISRP